MILKTHQRFDGNWVKIQQKASTGTPLIFMHYVSTCFHPLGLKVIDVIEQLLMIFGDSNLISHPFLRLRQILLLITTAIVVIGEGVTRIKVGDRIAGMFFQD